MALSNPPLLTSLDSHAKLVRHIFLSDLGRSYVVWVGPMENGFEKFIKRPMEEINLSGVIDRQQVIIPVDTRKIDHFNIMELGISNHVLFLFDDGTYVWTFTYDFGNEVVTEPLTQLYIGEVPTLVEDVEGNQAVYIRNLAIQSRLHLSGSERTVVDITRHDIEDQDIIPESVDYITDYVAMVSPNPNIARPFERDGDTEILYLAGHKKYFYDGGGVSGSNYDVGGVNLSYNSNDPSDFRRVLNGFESYLAKNGSEWDNRAEPADSGDYPLVFYRWDGSYQYSSISFFVSGSEDLYGASSYLVEGRDISNNLALRVHLPWSNNYIYYYYGNSGGSSDYINKVNSEIDVESGWTHWLFTKTHHVSNSSLRRLAIYRNGVLWYDQTGKSYEIQDLYAFYIVPRWYGKVKEVAVFKDDMSSQAAELYASASARTPLTTSAHPNLSHYWTFISSGEIDYMKDFSGYERHASLGETAKYTSTGLKTYGYVPTTPAWTVGNGITIEAWVVPSLLKENSYVTFGSISFGFTSNGNLFFRFEDAEFYQTSEFIKLKRNKLVYIAVSHTFGSGGNTFMSIDGLELGADWIRGTGDEGKPTPEEGSSIDISKHDSLYHLMISSRAKTISEIQSYLRGEV